MGILVGDIRYAARVLAKNPMFSSIAILTLALGIGGNTAIFTLLDQVLLRLLPVKEPQQLVLLTMRGHHYGNNWGGTVVWRNTVITDAAGNPRPLPSGRGDYTTKQAQGKIYALLMHMAATVVPQSLANFSTQQTSTNVAAEDQLWDEVGIWVQIRNDVAHEGAWQPPHPTESTQHANARAAIISRGRDNTIESGGGIIAKKIQEVARSVISAAIHGTL